MNQLCFMSALTSSELAAWVQAIGSILAVGGAAFAAIYQAKKQNATALRVQQDQRLYTRIETIKALLELSRNCGKLIEHIVAQLNDDRTAVHQFADGERHLDFDELVRVEQAVVAIPLHSLPSKLLTSTMLVSSVVRQFRAKVENAFKFHREMNAAAFEDFFKSMGAMKFALAHTCADIETELTKTVGDHAIIAQSA
jgi:hypothetical protein